MRLTFIFITLFSLLSPLISLSSEKFISNGKFVIPDLSTTVKKPKLVIADIDYLYHWTSENSLHRMASGFVEKSPHPFMKKINDLSMISHAIPSLKNQPGIFVWPNSIGAMGTSEKDELYFDPKSPALLRFKMKPNLKILIVVTDGRTELDISTYIGKVDVIFHTRKWVFHEFIIVNPNSVVELTAHPKQLTVDIKRDRKNFESTDLKDFVSDDFLFIAPDLYVNFGELSEVYNRLLVPTTDKVLKSTRNLPKVFKQETLELGKYSCARYY